ncbi:hypothetical protein Taro_032260 [Colocasia esculenta]|uniref:Uncharacterized protein n=1 Tax=Colocasia esculenta TaxID=4460 RepID=A0A843VYS3_COLES|nr:hypothetical protein [Colocasia esculenta]
MVRSRTRRGTGTSYTSHENWFTTPAIDSDKQHKYTFQSRSHGRKVQLLLHLNKTRIVKTTNTTPADNKAAGSSLTPLGTLAENPKVRHWKQD